MNRTAVEGELFAWIESVRGGIVRGSSRTSGGNRMWSWLVDVDRHDSTHETLFLRFSPPREPGAEPYTLEREVDVYRAISGVQIRAPRLIAVHPTMPAMLTTCAAGVAELRRLANDDEKECITDEFMRDLALLHADDRSELVLAGGVTSAVVADHVRAELKIWRAMYEESGRSDGLIDLALGWLEKMVPETDVSPVLVHGDAGPGNFLYEHGHLTAIIDWELAHVGDPMEDLAWFSMRCVMEPVPNFAAALASYAEAAGSPLDYVRLRYHRVFVSTRVVIIRHRNVTGEPAAAIVSRALNRRLLTQALAEAVGIRIETPQASTAAPTRRTDLFDHVIGELRDVVLARSSDAQVRTAAKSAAKVLKYLEAIDRDGGMLSIRALNALVCILPDSPTDLEQGAVRLAGEVAAGRLDLADALRFFACHAADEAALAAASSGSIATRSYPSLKESI